MSAIHGVEGLTKWIKGDEWRNDFEAVFDRHVGPACRGAGVELEELADIIGDHGMTVLWGCAFEDFVSSGSGERNVADEYLKRRGWKESAGARAYLRALQVDCRPNLWRDDGRRHHCARNHRTRDEDRDAIGQFRSARRPRARDAVACSRGTRARSPRRAAEHRTDDGVIAGAFGTGHRSPPAGRGAKIVHQALTDHYRKTLDEPIPALGGQTPRKAVKTAKGRKKVIAWLKMLENQSAQQRPEDPMGAYDFTWLWRELGVGDERR